MPHLREWMLKTVGIDTDHKAPAQVCGYYVYIALF